MGHPAPTTEGDTSMTKEGLALIEGPTADDDHDAEIDRWYN
jgi:hypothetical protein